jgi:hypothetical protein
MWRQQVTMMQELLPCRSNIMKNDSSTQKSTHPVAHMSSLRYSILLYFLKEGLIIPFIIYFIIIASAKT